MIPSCLKACLHLNKLVFLLSLDDNSQQTAFQHLTHIKFKMFFVQSVLGIIVLAEAHLLMLNRIAKKDDSHASSIK